MSITTEMDQNDYADHGLIALAFGLYVPANSTKSTERPYQFSKPYGSFASSSSLTPSDTGEYFANFYPRLNNNRGVFPCPTKEFPRTEKVFPRIVQ